MKAQRLIGLIVGVMVVSATLGGSLWLWRGKSQFKEVATPSTPPPTEVSTPSPFVESTTPSSKNPITTTRTILPKKALLTKVPFIEQTPLKNWDAVHEETCEEAAMLTVVHYLKGDQRVDPQTQEDELQKLISWETDHLGGYEDETVDQAAQVLREYFGLSHVRVITHATLADLKREVSSGHPVIVPAAGRLLHNKYFKTPGPIYHMTVVIGYTAGEIITNDPGTQHGEGYRYPTTTFWDAVHDFVDRTDDGMARGEKKLLVIDQDAQSR